MFYYIIILKFRCVAVNNLFVLGGLKKSSDNTRIDMKS